MEIRPVTAEDLPALSQIVSQSFERGRPVTLGPERLLTASRFGLFEGGRLQAALGIIPFETHFRAVRRPLGGIGGVASAPASRGRGYAGALIAHALRTMRNQGQYLSLLWPFNHSFYRAWGWDWVGGYREIRAQMSALPDSAENARYVEQVYGEFGAALNPVYDELAARFNGAIVRTNARWDRLMTPQARIPSAFVYTRDGQAEGFAILRHGENDKEGERELRAEHFGALTARAYRGLLGLARHHAMSADKFIWPLVPGDPIWSLAAHWDLEMRSVPGPMGRIVDARAALEALAPAAGFCGRVIVRIEDERAAWNQGLFSVTVEAGRVSVAEACGEPDVALDIQTLSQAYWGQPSLEHLREWDRVRVRDEEGFALLYRLMPATGVWVADDF